MKKLVTILLAALVLCSGGFSVSASAPKQGDVNGDGRVTTLDYAMVKRSVLRAIDLSATQQKAADVNGDGRVNAIDYMLIKRVVLKKGKFPCIHEYSETVVGNLHVFTCKSCGHQYERFDGELIG